MILEVITPDEVLYKGHVSQVILPGLDGSFGILNSHAPLISALAKVNSEAANFAALPMLLRVALTSIGISPLTL